MTRAARHEEALARSTEAVALFDSGRDVDSPEEILFIHARTARAAGNSAVQRDALRRAHLEVQRKARRLRDHGWRARYLAAPPARDIVAAAQEAGVDDVDLTA